VVPVWNGAATLALHLPRMVDAVRAAAGEAEVVVVDDGSDVERREVAAVVSAAGAPARLLRREVNSGFGAACNAGARAATGTSVLFLNSDMHLDEGCLEAVLAAHERRPDVFAVTPVIINVEGGFPESTTRIRFHHGVFDLVLPGRDGEPDVDRSSERAVAYGCGGALLCRRSVFLDLGGFSPLYAPFYWEDADLGWRARRAGLESLEVGAARVVHQHARTIGARYPASRIRATYERNRLLFTWVHAAGLHAWAAHAGWFVPRLLAALVRRDPAWRGMLAAFGRLGGAWRERRRQRRSADVALALLVRVEGTAAGGWPVHDGPSAIP
jgi:GT2 family glycosyltransferase